MRIAHLCASFSPLSETFIYDHVTELARQGMECHVLTFERKHEHERPFDQVITLPMPSKWHVKRLWPRLLAEVGLGNAWASYWPLLRPEVETALRHLAPDVIHAHFGPMGVLVARIAEALDIPLIVSFYGYDVSRLTRKTACRKTYGLLFDHASALIGISNHICSKLKDLGASPDKIRLVHLGSRVDRFTYSDPRERFDGKTVRCLHVGRLVEKKAPILLVQAFQHAQSLLGKALTLQLSIAGEGPLRRPLERTIAAMNLQDHVTLLGATSHAEIPALMQTAHLYTQHCITARDGDQEGQGVSFVEASASGLPIVSTWHNGLPDVILHEESGFLVPEGDVHAMGKQIATVASNPDLWQKFGKRGRAHIETHFELDKQVQCLSDVYETTLRSTANRLTQQHRNQSSDSLQAVL